MHSITLPTHSRWLKVRHKIVFLLSSSVGLSFSAVILGVSTTFCSVWISSLVVVDSLWRQPCLSCSALPVFPKIFRQIGRFGVNHHTITAALMTHVATYDFETAHTKPRRLDNTATPTPPPLHHFKTTTMITRHAHKAHKAPKEHVIDTRVLRSLRYSCLLIAVATNSMIGCAG